MCTPMNRVTAYTGMCTAAQMRIRVRNVWIRQLTVCYEIQLQKCLQLYFFMIVLLYGSAFFSFSKTGRHIHRIPLHIIRMYGIRTWNHSLNTCPAQPYRRYRHRISDRGHWRACGNSWCWRQYSRRPFPSSHFPIPLLPHSRLQHNHATRHRRRQSYPEDPLTGSVFLQGFRKLRFSFQELLHWFRCQRGFCMLFCFISLCFISLYFCSFYL